MGNSENLKIVYVSNDPEEGINFGALLKEAKVKSFELKQIGCLTDYVVNRDSGSDTDVARPPNLPASNLIIARKRFDHEAGSFCGLKQFLEIRKGKPGTSVIDAPLLCLLTDGIHEEIETICGISEIKVFRDIRELIEFIRDYRDQLSQTLRSHEDVS